MAHILCELKPKLATDVNSHVITSLNKANSFKSTLVESSLGLFHGVDQAEMNQSAARQLSKLKKSRTVDKEFAEFDLRSINGFHHKLYAVPVLPISDVISRTVSIVQTTPTIVHSLRGKQEANLTRDASEQKLIIELSRELVQLGLDHRVSFADRKSKVVEAVNSARIVKSRIPAAATNLDAFRQDTTDANNGLTKDPENLTPILSKFRKALEYRSVFMSKMAPGHFELYDLYLGNVRPGVPANPAPGIPDGCWIARKYGVVRVIDDTGMVVFETKVNLNDYFDAQRFFYTLINDDDCTEYAKRKLKQLVDEYLNYQHSFALHENKILTQDISSVPKHDAHSHLGGFLPPIILCNFINRKMAINEVVDVSSDGRRTPVRFKDLVAATGWDITKPVTPAALKMSADACFLDRFPKFNLRFKVMGNAALTKVILGKENYLKGRYFAELISGFTLSLYGRTLKEEMENIQSGRKSILKPILPNTVCRNMVWQLTTLMRKMYKCNLFHLDLHSGNIIFTRDLKKLKMIDFGMSKSFEKSEEDWITSLTKDLTDYKSIVASLVEGHEHLMRIAEAIHTDGAKGIHTDPYMSILSKLPEQQDSAIL